MRARRARMLLVVTLVGAGLLAGCGSGSTPLLHGGKLGPRLGVQAGWLMPVDGGDLEYGGGVIAGAAVRIGANLASPLGLELGAAFSRLEAEDASVDLTFLRARALYASGIGGFCWRFGMQMVRQNPEESGRSLDQYDGWAIDLGFLFGQRYEMGLNYSILVGSDNVPGTAEVTLGVNF